MTVILEKQSSRPSSAHAQPECVSSIDIFNGGVVQSKSSGHKNGPSNQVLSVLSFQTNPRTPRVNNDA